MQRKEEKISEIRKDLEMIVEELEVASQEGSKLHDVERSLLNRLLQLGLQLLSYYILLVSQKVRQTGRPLDGHGEKMHHKGEQSRTYFSVFGRLSVERIKYYSSNGGVHYSLDKALGLPSGVYSYLLEDWMAFGATEMDFEQSVSYLERILGHCLHGMQSSRCTYHLSGQVERFYERQDTAFDAESTHLSVGYDGKGVPIRRCETDRAEQSTGVRLSKGQKRDIKREATVSVSNCFVAQPRSAEQIIDSLFSTAEQDVKQPKHYWHKQKHIRAFLSNKSKAISYGIEDILKRDQTRSGQTRSGQTRSGQTRSGQTRSGQTKSKPIIVLIDGDRALEKAVKETVVSKGIDHRVEAYVLDFIHLLEYVWKVANARWGEKHPERETWVKEQARLLLNSEWKTVLAQWQNILHTQQLSRHQAYNVNRAITYLSNRPHMLDYKTYLEKGYPITTGAIESACGHFVKSRMERNAMHWGKQGAQEMLNIRAIKKNGDWQQYIHYFIEQEQQKLYQRAA